MTRCNFAKLLMVLSISLIMSEAAAQISGVVVVGEKKCHKRDRIVIATNVGFTLAEQYGGSFDKDDTIVGELNSFGFKDVLVNGVAGRLWIDDFMASRNKAEKWCFGDR